MKEKISIDFACSFKNNIPDFQHYLQWRKNGGQEGRGEAKYIYCNMQYTYNPSATQGRSQGVLISYYGGGWEVLLQKIVHLKILILHAKERKFEKFTIH